MRFRTAMMAEATCAAPLREYALPPAFMRDSYASAKLAGSLLETMQATLERMYEHRAMIEAAIAAGEP